MSTALEHPRNVGVVGCAYDLFFAHLGPAAHRVLLLDYDGTLAPFSPDRTKAAPYGEVPRLLTAIMRTCRTRVVVITGRAAREIPMLLAMPQLPEIWGSYGTEHLTPDGRYRVRFISDSVQHTLAEADAWLQEEGLDNVVELKPGAVAVHWRGLHPRELEEVRTKAYRALSPFGFQGPLVLAEFDGGLELRLRTRSKADVIETILGEIGSDPVAYLGDDITDEDAFRALRGRGLTVLVRPTYRFTAAQTWIRPPEDLRQFLTDWIHACGGRSE